jgi:hypothetical protein
MKKSIRNKKGFSLVELMLAVAFLGTLLLSIAILTMQLINIYTKGATMRAINSLGSSMMKDIRTSIVASNSYPKNLDSDVEEYYWNNKGVLSPEPTAGMFCTGSYSYVWNYQTAMMHAYRGVMEPYYYIEVGTASNERAYGFARIKDANCNRFRDLKKDYEVTGNTNKGKITLSSEEEMTVLLDGKKGGDGTDLALYDFSIISATRSNGLSGKGLYDVSFVIGTMRGGINVNSSSNYCSNNYGGSDDATQVAYADASISYCAVNRFEFVVRQSGMKF